MSLRDTIEGAANEAKENASGLKKADASKDKEKDVDAKKVPAYDPLAVGKASAANARPATEAGASVRMEGERAKKNKATMTKEEKKEARRQERELEDARNRAYDLILRANPDYKKTDRMWWILLGIGFACTILSLVLAYVYPDESRQYTTTQGIGAVVTLVLAYAFIIGAFVYDLVKRRPLRKSTERKLQGMNDKRVADFLEEENKRLAAEVAQKEAKKAGK